MQINWSKQCMNYLQINVDDRLRWYKMELTSTGWTSSPISVFVAKSVLSICCCYYMLMIFSGFDFFLFGYYLQCLLNFAKFYNREKRPAKFMTTNKEIWRRCLLSLTLSTLRIWIYRGQTKTGTLIYILTR